MNQKRKDRKSTCPSFEKLVEGITSDGMFTPLVELHYILGV